MQAYELVGQSIACIVITLEFCTTISWKVVRRICRELRLIRKAAVDIGRLLLRTARSVVQLLRVIVRGVYEIIAVIIRGSSEIARRFFDLVEAIVGVIDDHGTHHLDL